MSDEKPDDLVTAAWDGCRRVVKSMEEGAEFLEQRIAGWQAEIVKLQDRLKKQRADIDDLREAIEAHEREVG